MVATFLHAGRETGSATNHMMSRSDRQSKPEVGMGATVLCWTDRHAGTIVKITAKQIHVQMDKAIRTDSNGMSESQDYQYEVDPQGKTDIFRITKRGYRNARRNGLLIGYRDAYHDFSF